jgi:S1-C subfamily serine protease
MITTLALVLSLSAFASAQHEDHKDKHDHGGMQMEPQLPPPNPNQGYFGAKFGPISDEMAEELGLDSQDGVVIFEILPDSPAQKAGVQVNDVVRKLDDKEIMDVPGFVTVMRASKPEQQLKVAIIRDKQPQEFTVTLGKRPPSMNEQQIPKDKEPTTKPSDK